MARDDPVKQCRGVLQQLQKNRAAVVFLHPVDWKALKLPAYPKIVKNPMDLSTVEHKLKSGKYHKVRDFAKDVNQIWQNAHLFNQEGSDIHDWAAQLREEFAGFNSTAPTTRPCAQPCAQPCAPPCAQPCAPPCAQPCAPPYPTLPHPTPPYLPPDPPCPTLPHPSPPYPTLPHPTPPYTTLPHHTSPHSTIPHHVTLPSFPSRHRRVL